MSKRLLRAVLLTMPLLLASVVAHADASGNPAPVKEQDGIWTDANGDPTYKIAKDGTVDWGTYVGFTRYGANCLQCHGPDALGSSYAPSLVDALKTINYQQFFATVAGGKKNVSASSDLVMPALGTDRNVMCFINEIYVYLRARADGALGRGRPEKHAPKPAGFSAKTDACVGS